MSPKKIARPVDIYVRVSAVRGREGDSFISPVEQEERCRAAIKTRGLQAGEVFTDLDQSGKRMKRPALDAAIERIESGESGGIIVARLDRFSRTLIGGVQTLKEINDAGKDSYGNGGGVVIVAEGDFELDTSSAQGELFLSMLLTFAQFELSRIREKWADAQTRAVDRGIHISPRVPAGYVRGEDDRLVPNGKSAETIREAFKMAARGETYAHIAWYLNDRELPMWSGKGVWQPNRIRRLLDNRVYLGEARYGELTKEGAHDPLTDIRTFTLATQRDGKRTTAARRSPMLLAGLCRCAGCSYAMSGRQGNGKMIGRYRCADGTHKCPSPSTIGSNRIEAYVLEQFLAHESVQLERSDEPDEDDEARVQAALDAEADYKATVANVELRQALGATEHNRLVVALKRAWDDAVANLPQPKAGAVATSTIDLERLVTDLREHGKVDDLRELISTVIEAVYVRPSSSGRRKNAPVSDRVKIVWQGEENLELPKRGTRFEPKPYTWN